MAADLTVEQARARLQDGSPLGTVAFDLLDLVAQLIDPTREEPDPEAVELAIRLLERRDEFEELREPLNAVLRAVGLFPYIPAEELGIADLIAYEAHRPRGISGLVFHRVQGELYRRVLAGENIMLSAPTSFGKSLIVDALLATGRYSNVVIVVPTLALIDETRRRLARFGNEYKIITHPSQPASERNVFVMTQERLLDLESLPATELFIIDEFYKLDTRRDSERSTLLNTAFHRLWRSGAQFLLLGPNIQGVTEQLPSGFRASFVHTDFRTVAADITRIPATRSNERAMLLQALEGLEGATLVYCRSPKRAQDIAGWVLESDLDWSDGSLDDAIDWLSEEFHPDWYLVEALRRGVGVHHGKLPRSLAQWMVRAFNEGRLKTLICTSTLIEGVNTRAKNVVIFDNRIAMSAFDHFTFNNIRGRSGRMFQHFVGRVILFHEPPAPTLPVLDIPSLSQSSNADDSLLLQFDPSDLTESSKARVAPYLDQDILSLETLRANSGIDPERQLATARAILGDPALASELSWSGYPTFGQLAETGSLLLKELKGQTQFVSGVFSGRQLAFLMTRVSRLGGDVKSLIDAELEGDKSVDAAVEDTLDFLRYWPGHNFPRYLMALDRIQREVLPRLGIAPGDYRLYAAQAESMFVPAPLHSLEEYGLPVQLVSRLRDEIEPNGQLDDALDRLAELRPRQLDLHPFERELLKDAIRHLGRGRRRRRRSGQ
jgi:hypothetical protein